MRCLECGGSDLQGTCVCSYEFPPEPDMSPIEDRERWLGMLTGPPPYASVEIPDDLKQICHFCGVDLFLPKTDLDIRMCVPCGLGLNHEECCKCVVCDKIWLVRGEGSVCEFCRSL